jgi:hypothetical protein
MSLDIEERLEQAAASLPAPKSESRDRARAAALAALGQPPRRGLRRVGPVVPAIALTAAVAFALFLAAPWRDSPLATERALAALGDDPVVHAIVEQPGERTTIIELASGRERVVPLRTEYWYDGERGILRARLSSGERLLPGGEYLHSSEGFFTDRGVHRGQKPPQLDPALERFASGYREALASGDATVVGEELIDGRKAIILRFSLPAGSSGEHISEDVAVDAEHYRPLRFRFSSTADPSRTSSWSEAPRVVQIETIPHDPVDFEPPRAGEPRPGGQTGVGERTLEPAEAATALGRPALWPGRVVAGVELTEIELTRLTTRWTDGRETEGHALVFQYGTDRRTAHLEGKPSLIITEGTSIEHALRFDLGGSTPGPGELAVAGVGRTARGEAEMWFGSMRRDGIYVSFESPQRGLILAAAKAMVALG